MPNSNPFVRPPRGWNQSVRAGVLHAIALANSIWLQVASSRRSDRRAVSARGELSQFRREIELLREQLRIKDARFARVAPHRRPHYTPVERLAILELKAAQGWSLAQTANTFLVAEPTVASWLVRLDETGPTALVRTSDPVNKFPELVGYLVRRLKVLCPELGRRKLADTLARAGLHLGAATVARMLRQLPRSPDRNAPKSQCGGSLRAQKPHDVWHIDLTVMPTGGGFWTTWLPWALPQRFPFGWWILAVVDRHSRRALQLGCHAEQPTSYRIRKSLERAIRAVEAKPRVIVCDRGVQFDCREFRSFCRRRRIEIRYGAVGRYGSIALIERFMRTLKEKLRKLSPTPLEQTAMYRELRLFHEWYNEHRPHEALGGNTPNEVYERRFPQNRRPRHEPRSRWPRGSPCARPWALPRGRPGAELQLEVEYLGGRRHLPIATLRRVA